MKAATDNLQGIVCEVHFPAGVNDGAPATHGRSAGFSARFASPIAVHLAYEHSAVSSTINAAEAATARGNWVVGFVSYEAAKGFDFRKKIKAFLFLFCIVGTISELFF